MRVNGVSGVENGGNTSNGDDEKRREKRFTSAWEMDKWNTAMARYQKDSGQSAKEIREIKNKADKEGFGKILGEATMKLLDNDKK